MAKQKESCIQAIRKFLRKKLVEKDCLRTNGFLGLFMLLGTFPLFLIGTRDYPLDIRFVYIQAIAGTVLAGGSLLAVCNASLTQKVLVLQGAMICFLVLVYTAFMGQAAELIRLGEMQAGMGHAPGILACGAAYGIKQVIRFSSRSNPSDPRFLHRLPIVFFVGGACCDVIVAFMMIRCFFFRV